MHTLLAARLVWNTLNEALKILILFKDKDKDTLYFTSII